MLKVVQGWRHNKILRLAHAITGGHVIYAIRTHDGPKHSVFPHICTPYLVFITNSRGNIVIRTCDQPKSLYISPIFTKHIWS